MEAEYGGTDSSFFMSCLVVEELAKIDPAVSVMCDVQNTLIVTLFRKYGTPQQKEQYLPRLAENMVNNLLLTIQRMLLSVANDFVLGICIEAIKYIVHTWHVKMSDFAKLKPQGDYC